MDEQNNVPQADDYKIAQNHFSNRLNAWEMYYYEGYSLKVFSSVKKILKSIVTTTEQSIRLKLYHLARIDTLVYCTPPTKLLKDRNCRGDDGTTLQELIESTLSFIQSNGPPTIDIETFVVELENVQELLVPSEVYIRVIFTNIVHCLQEMKEVLERADGTLDEMFEFGEESPFLNTNFIDYQFEGNKMYVFRQFYRDDHYSEISEECNEHLTKVCEPVDLIENCHKFMAKFTQKVNFLIANHKKNFYDEDYINEHSVHDLLAKVIEYLSHFKMRINIEQFSEEQELEKSILSTIDGLSFILHSLPLDKLLHLFINSTSAVKQRLKNILCIIRDILLIVTNGSLRAKLSKLRMVVLQIWNINGKDSVTGSRASDSELYTELNKYLVTQADIVTSKSLQDWKLKYEDNKTNGDILKSCPHDKCYVCFEKFADLLEDSPTSGDLAVIHSCLHLFCLRCMEETVRVASDK